MSMYVYVGLAKSVHTYIVSVYGNFRSYQFPYDRTWVLADRIYAPYVRSKQHIRRIWTAFAGGAVRFPATAVFFALFGQFSFLAPLLTELFLCFPFLLMRVLHY
jgi:hypothetical protein